MIKLQKTFAEKIIKECMRGINDKTLRISKWNTVSGRNDFGK